MESVVAVSTVASLEHSI